MRFQNLTDQFGHDLSRDLGPIQDDIADLFDLQDKASLTVRIVVNKFFNSVLHLARFRGLKRGPVRAIFKTKEDQQCVQDSVNDLREVAQIGARQLYNNLLKYESHTELIVLLKMVVVYCQLIRNPPHPPVDQDAAA